MVGSDDATTATEAQGLATQLWRAITRGRLSEAKRLLLRLPAAQGVSFTFDDVSVLTGEAEGTSPVTPVARGWSAELPVAPVLYDPAAECGGIPDAAKHKGDDCFKVCIEPKWGGAAPVAERCDRTSHRTPGNRFPCRERVWLISFPRANPTTKRCAFSRPSIAESEFPENYQGFDTMLALAGPPAKWLTAFELVPRRDALAAFALEVEVDEEEDLGEGLGLGKTGVEVGPGVGAPETKEEVVGSGAGSLGLDPGVQIGVQELEDLLARLGTLEARVLLLEDSLAEAERANRTVQAELEVATETLQDISLRDAMLGETIRKTADAALGDQVREALKIARDNRRRGAGGGAGQVDEELIAGRIERRVRPALEAVVDSKLGPMGAQFNREVSSLQTMVAQHDAHVSSLNHDMNAADGRVQKCLDRSQRVEDQADVGSVEVGGEVFRADTSVRALFTTGPAGEAYRLFMDFATLLHLVTDPYLDFQGAMEVENARTKAKFGSVLAARVAVAHRLRYPPVVLKGSSQDEDNVTYKFSAGFKTFRAFEGTHNSGTRYEILNSLKTVKGNMRKAIERVYPAASAPQLHAVFTDALARGCDQVKDWLDSIRTFQDTMEAGGIDEKMAWESNCVYIKRILDDVHEAKSHADEGADASTMIWGSMCALRKVDEYSKLNWIEHQSVGSMLVLTVMENQAGGALGENLQKALSRADEGLEKVKSMRAEIGAMRKDIARKQDK